MRRCAESAVCRPSNLIRIMPAQEVADMRMVALASAVV